MTTNATPRIIPQVIPVGGRLTHFLGEWKRVTDDAYILGIIQNGYEIPFLSRPPLSHDCPATLNGGLELWPSVLDLLSKGAIEEVFNYNTGSFFNRLFLVPKPDGTTRPILDLKILNTYVRSVKFTMETTRSVRLTIELDELASLLDLIDAFLHVPLALRSRKYVRFMVLGRVFQFRSLPFGLCTAPLTFCKVCKPVIRYLRARSIPVHPYMDDWLLRFKPNTDSMRSLRFVLALLRNLGFGVHPKKSHLSPSCKFQFLGVLFDTRAFTVSAIPARLAKLKKLTHSLRLAHPPTARHVTRVVGLLESVTDLIFWARLRMRPIQWFLSSQWNNHADTIDLPIDLTLFPWGAVDWFLDQTNFFSAVPIREPLPTHRLFTDASLHGWGATLDNEWETNDTWPTTNRPVHINLLELRAILLAVKFFLPRIAGSTLLILTDNTTALAYIKNQGGTRSLPLFRCADILLSLCEKYNIRVQAQHIPGKLNVRADSLSRSSPTPTEWRLHPNVCLELFTLWGHPLIDLFATRWNHQLPTFVSPFPDNRALTIDALSISWKGMYAYLFPPTALLPRILSKIREEDGRFLVIAPNWPSQIWFPELISLLIDSPRQLPGWSNLLTQSQGRLLHPCPQMFRLHGWLLSRDQSLRKAFLMQSSAASSLATRRGHGTSTNHTGIIGWTGAKGEILIQSSPLLRA